MEPPRPTRHWLLDRHPEGPATPDCWIAPGTNYAAGVGPGGVMQGGGVAQVIASRHPDWAEGDVLETMALGWREHAVLNPDAPGPARANRVPPPASPRRRCWAGTGCRV